MTKIELIGEILKVCDEKEKLEIDNGIMKKKIDEYESAKGLDENKPVCIGEDNPSIKTKLMFANSLIDNEVRGLHKSITENGNLSHNENGNVLQDYPSYYPNYRIEMTFNDWMSEVDWDSVDSYTSVGGILKRSFSLDDIKLLYLEAYREVFNFLKKKAEEAKEEETGDDEE